MNAVDRRTMLKAALGGVAVVGLTMATLPRISEAAPVALGKDIARKTEDLIEKVQMGPPPPPPPGWRRRRRRRWVCWWRRGRRVCAWRWV